MADTSTYNVIRLSKLCEDMERNPQNYTQEDRERVLAELREIQRQSISQHGDLRKEA